MSVQLTPSKRPQDCDQTESNGKEKLQKIAASDSPSVPAKTSHGSMVYRLLCPASKIDSVIGDGSFISQIRQETETKVEVEEAIPGCDERVISIIGADKDSETNVECIKGGGDAANAGGGDTANAGGGDAANAGGGDAANAGGGDVANAGGGDAVDAGGGDAADAEVGDAADAEVGDTANAEGSGDKNEDNKEVIEEIQSTHGGNKKFEKGKAPIQLALIRIFERIVEGKSETKDKNEENNRASSITLRILVLSIQVGCLLGKGGSVIKKMASASGAQIRIVPRDKVPSCVTSSDELV